MPFTITLITESGLTQDLTLIPNRKAFQSILLKPEAPLSGPPKKPLKERICNLLATMRRNKTLKVHRSGRLEGRIHTSKIRAGR